MRVVTYNIQFSRGKDLNHDLERIARTVAGADVIGLQEVERNWPHLDMADQPAELARLLPDYYWVYGAGLDIDGSDRRPDGAVVNRRCQVANMLLSKTPIVATRNHLLPKLALLDFPNDQRIPTVSWHSSRDSSWGSSLAGWFIRLSFCLSKVIETFRKSLKPFY